jgi:uncharacterized protein YraI
MESEFLYRDSSPESIKPKHPSAVVNNKNGSSWVNLRHGPSLNSPIARQPSNGSVVTILGETDSHWYYVKMGKQYGYIKSEYLTVSGSQASVKTGSEYVKFSLPNPVPWEDVINIRWTNPISWEEIITTGQLSAVTGTIRFEPDKSYPVYSARGTEYARSRGNNGKASVGTNEPITVYGIPYEDRQEKAFLLIQYKIDSNNYRFGFITDFAIHADDVNKIPIVLWNAGWGYINAPVDVTDDPLHSQRTIDRITENLEASACAFLGNDWLLVSYINDDYAAESWGFIPVNKFYFSQPGE